MLIKQRLFCASVALLITGFATAQSKSDQADSNHFAIKNVRVFDGVQVFESTNVVVKDGRIFSIGKKLTTADAPVIDGAGKTLLPGLIDAHTHSWLDAQQDALRFGVTTELDMMGDWNRLPVIKKQRDSMAKTDQADLYSAGAAVTAPGGHGTQFGTKPPTLAKGADAKAFVDARVAEGSDYIKLIVEDFSAYSTTKSLPTIDAAQIKASIQAAHAAKRLAVAHVSTQKAAAAVIAAGADGLVHVFADQVIDAPLVKLSKKRNAFVVPTLSVLASVAGSGEGAKLAADSQLQKRLTNLQKLSLKQQFRTAPNLTELDRALQSVKALHAAGVDVLAGTDAGNPGTAHGASIHGELELLVRAGLSPKAALAAATSVPATALIYC
jgi:imidazolonepropionase-like amidohydrolase